MIPRRLVRVVPEHTTAQVETWWAGATALHPGWEHVTRRQPHDPDLFPRTAPYWPDCETGAQLADLVRAEELWHWGGVYIDSDVEVFKPFDNLVGLPAFAGWEDGKRVCNAVLGFPPHHPVLRDFLDLAIERRHHGTEAAGVATFTEIVTGRDDVVLLPPDAFYPAHWSEEAHPSKVKPWSWTLHYWAKSWHA
ncbi:glycosyltransferase [Mycolicibacterium sphagni]|uniref:glycosyltransferase n=1 Tax=Mycolicibacterium sphagni TaxID=1786 RepID=UPI0013FDDCD5|nr:glycosyltransferase [Mycolicibacterium sphagni]